MTPINDLCSVVMIVRNGETYLAAALDSVLAQDYAPYEIIVVDGHSTDQTVAIAESYPDTRVVVQPAQGVSDAYNTGIAHARGEFIAFLSHDDLWTPDKLRVQIGYLKAHPEVEYCIGMTHFFLEPGSPLPAGFKPELIDTDYTVRIMEVLVARARVFERVGLFDPAYWTADDVDWYARAHDVGVPMAVIPQVTLHKRIHTTNTSLSDISAARGLMFQALRASIHRKRRAAQSGGSEGQAP